MKFRKAEFHKELSRLDDNRARVQKSRWVKARGFDGKFSEPDGASASVKFPRNLSRRQIFLTIFKISFERNRLT